MAVNKEERAVEVATETLQRSDRIIHKLAVLIGVVISITCIGVLILAFQTADLLKEDSQADAKIAADTQRIAKNNRVLLEQSLPCLPDDPPESPACQEAKRVAALVDDIIKRLATEQARRLTVHDANVRRDHEALHKMHQGSTVSRLPRSTPIPHFAHPTTTTTRPPASTTTVASPLPTTKSLPTTPISCKKEKKSGECKEK